MTVPGPELLSLQQALTGRYAVERVLGRGGMGMVFLARDLALDRPVAIKLLAPALARETLFRDRFLREARAAARLSHPHIVPVHSVEEHDTVVAFVMGFVDGETLAQRVTRAGPLSDADGLRVMREVAWALGHAHAMGIVHRDVKPENIMLERHTGRAVVTDFGIAGVAFQPASSGERVGTPAYMSPEQVSDAPVDPRSDLYSLGGTMWYAFSGRTPFEGPADRILAARLTSPAPSITSLRPDLPGVLAQAVDRCLAPAPEDRPASAEALLDLLTVAPPALNEAPLPVASYVRTAGGVLGDVGTTFVAGSTALLVYAIGFRDDLYAAIAFYPIAALLYAIGLTRFGELVLHTRTLVGQGYGHDAVRPAVELEVRREAAERSLAASLPGRLTDRPVVMATIGAAKTGLFIWLATRGIDTLTLIGVAGAVLIPTATVRSILRSTGRMTSVWAGMVKGRLGRWLFRLGRMGQGRGALPAPDAPTAVFLGDAALRMFEALPADRRRQLAALPETVTRLQADALNATEGTRLKALVALENLRLDLLRLQAGQVQSDQLTRDLEDAGKIAALVDATLGRSTPAHG